MAFDWYTTGALVVVAAWLLWKYLSWNHGYWQRLGVPCVQPSVPFGNMKDVMLGKRHAADVIRDIYCQIEGQPFCGLYRVRDPLLLVRDAELVRAMLVRDFPSFHDNNVHLNEELDPLFSRNPFVLKGEKWRRLRSQLSPSFTSSRLKPMLQLMKEVCDNLTRVLHEEGPKSQQEGMEARELCMRYTADVMTSCALGIRGDALDDPKSNMLEKFRLILDPDSNNLLLFMFTTAFPRFSTLFRIRFLPEKVDTFLRGLVAETVARRQADGDQRNDYLQMLVELKAKGYLDSAGQVLADREFFTDVDIAAQVATFMMDGIHTSATTMAFVLYELALNPDLQERLRRELKDSVDKHGGQLGYDVVHECTFLDMVISETLRLHAPLGHMEKTCTAPYNMTTPTGRSFTLEPGTTVLVSIKGLHLDPRYFPKPTVFDPERFSPDNRDRNSMQAFVPFGLGPRSCIGQRFALSQVKMGVAAVVLSAEVRRIHRTSVPIHVDPRYLLTASIDGLWLAFHPLEC